MLLWKEGGDNGLSEALRNQHYKSRRDLINSEPFFFIWFKTWIVQEIFGSLKKIICGYDRFSNAFVCRQQFS
jgi:hypothetical protein